MTNALQSLHSSQLDEKEAEGQPSAYKALKENSNEKRKQDS